MTRCIQNITTGQNITIDVLKKFHGRSSLIRSSVIIDAKPSEVASYYKNENSIEAQEEKVKIWSEYSALMNLARIDVFETVWEKDKIIVVKESTGSPRGFFGYLMWPFWTNKTFTLGQVWFSTDKEVEVKAPDTGKGQAILNHAFNLPFFSLNYVFYINFFS